MTVRKKEINTTLLKRLLTSNIQKVLMETIRTLFSREHETVLPNLGVFLAGPTPPNGGMTSGWRRVIVDKLLKDERLDPSMLIVSPEPESGNWNTIEKPSNGLLNKVHNDQIAWEWQYLQLCDITAFWLPTYFSKDISENFPANIGPTSRWEFGYYFQEYLKAPQKKHFIVGAPEDAESINWAKKLVASHGIKWHVLEKGDKEKQVAASFIEEIASTLVKNKWVF